MFVMRGLRAATADSIVGRSRVSGMVGIPPAQGKWRSISTCGEPLVPASHEGILAFFTPAAEPAQCGRLSPDTPSVQERNRRAR
jgi:hypothetical protein